MKHIQHYYLSYACDSGIPENIFRDISREKRTNCFGKNNDFYLEKYNKFEFLVDRIKWIYDLQLERCINGNVDIFSDECSWQELIVCNKNEETLIFGVSSYGWSISIFLFHYLDKYFEQRYGKENGKKMLEQKTEKNQVWFYLTNKTEPNIFSARELVSEETAIIILKNFMDGKDEQDLDPIIYEREIEKRNYLA